MNDEKEDKRLIAETLIDILGHRKGLRELLPEIATRVDNTKANDMEKLVDDLYREMKSACSCSVDS
jgi:hypothetical protein